MYHTIRCCIIKFRAGKFQRVPYSKSQRVISHNTRSQALKIPGHWNLDDALRFLQESYNVPAFDQSDCEVSLCYSLKCMYMYVM